MNKTEHLIEQYRQARQEIRRAIQYYENEELKLFQNLHKTLNEIRDTYPDSFRDEPKGALGQQAQAQEKPAKDPKMVSTERGTHWHQMPYLDPYCSKVPRC